MPFSEDIFTLIAIAKITTPDEVLPLKREEGVSDENYIQQLTDYLLSKCQTFSKIIAEKLAEVEGDRWKHPAFQPYSYHLLSIATKSLQAQQQLKQHCCTIVFFKQQKTLKNWQAFLQTAQIEIDQDDSPLLQAVVKQSPILQHYARSFKESILAYGEQQQILALPKPSNYLLYQIQHYQRLFILCIGFINDTAALNTEQIDDPNIQEYLDIASKIFQTNMPLQQGDQSLNAACIKYLIMLTDLQQDWMRQPDYPAFSASLKFFEDLKINMDGFLNFLTRDYPFLPEVLNVANTLPHSAISEHIWHFAPPAPPLVELSLD